MPLDRAPPVSPESGWRVERRGLCRSLRSDPATRHDRSGFDLHQHQPARLAVPEQPTEEGIERAVVRLGVGHSAKDLRPVGLS